MQRDLPRFLAMTMLACAGACSSSADSSSSVPKTCGPSTILVRNAFPLPDGALIRTAKITSAKIDLTTSPATLTGTLENGGSMSLRWKDDAKAGSVSVYGSVTWGATGGATTYWCVDEDSRMHLTSATDATFDKIVIGLGDGLTADDTYGSCHKADDGSGVPPPLPATVDYEGCFALPH